MRESSGGGGSGGGDSVGCTVLLNTVFYIRVAYVVSAAAAAGASLPEAFREPTSGRNIHIADRMRKCARRVRILSARAHIISGSDT